MKEQIEKIIDSLLSEYIAPGYVIWEPGVGYNNSGLYGQLMKALGFTHPHQLKQKVGTVEAGQTVWVEDRWGRAWGLTAGRDESNRPIWTHIAPPGYRGVESPTPPHSVEESSKYTEIGESALNEVDYSGIGQGKKKILFFVDSKGDVHKKDVLGHYDHVDVFHYTGRVLAQGRIEDQKASFSVRSGSRPNEISLCVEALLGLLEDYDVVWYVFDGDTYYAEDWIRRQYTEV